MDLKLNLKKKGKIYKTLTASTYDLSLGVCEDLIHLLKIGEHNGADKDSIPVSEIIKIIAGNYQQIIEILHEVFPDLTDEDRRNITIFDMKDIIIGIGKDTWTRLSNFNRKN